jgi:hypothetical protein
MAGRPVPFEVSMSAEIIQFVPGLKKPNAEEHRFYNQYREQLATYERMAHPDTAPSDYVAPSDDCA